VIPTQVAPPGLTTNLEIVLTFILERSEVLGPSSSILMEMSAPTIIEVTGDWRRLHNEELHNLYSSPNIIRMIRSRKMR
jgi:hypothetical protein